MSGIIYVWRCDVCDRKGATNIQPVSYADVTCVHCNSRLDIELFDDIFLNL